MLKIIKPLVIFICLIAICTTNAQNVVQYILQENFTDNRNSWNLFNTEDFTSEIKSGQLYFNNKTNNFKWSYITKKIDFKKDFVIETSIKLLSGTENNRLSLIFNKSNDGSTLDQLSFSDNGYWIYDKYRYKKDVKRTGWLNVNFIKSKEFNTLTVKKLDNKVFFLINNIPVLVKQNADLWLKQVGVGICPKAEMVVKHLAIGYLELSKTEKEEEVNKLYEETISIKQKGGNVIIENKPAIELFTDFTTNNLNFGLIDNDNSTIKIENNTLEINKKTEGTYSSWTNKRLNTSLDFDVSTSVKYISGRKDFGIVLLLSKDEHNLEIGYAENGHWYSLAKKNKKYNAHYSGWKKTNLVKQNQNNTLRIKKIGKAVYFIFNNKVLSKYNGDILVNTISLKVSNIIKAQFNKVKITQTYRSETEQKKLQTIYDELWDKAKEEKLGALGLSKEQQEKEKNIREKFYKKQRKAIEKYKKMFFGAPISEVTKKLGKPEKIMNSSLYYRYNDSYNGKPQYLIFFYIQSSYNGVKYNKVADISIRGK